jgi:hypothetical protein
MQCTRVSPGGACRFPVRLVSLEATKHDLQNAGSIAGLLLTTGGWGLDSQPPFHVNCDIGEVEFEDTSGSEPPWAATKGNVGNVETSKKIRKKSAIRRDVRGSTLTRETSSTNGGGNVVAVAASVKTKPAGASDTTKTNFGPRASSVESSWPLLIRGESTDRILAGRIS